MTTINILPTDYALRSIMGPDDNKYFRSDSVLTNRHMDFHSITFNDADLGEVGRLSWAEGTLCFTGDAEQSAEKFFQGISSRVDNYVQDLLKPYGNQNKIIAALLGLLDTEQMQHENAQAALNYLHDLEFFEKRILGEL